MCRQNLSKLPKDQIWYGRGIHCRKITKSIQAELTAPYTPPTETNGYVEWNNLSLVEMIRCMLDDSGSHKKFWGDAIMTANHLQNRLLVDGKETTLYGGWNKWKPDLSYAKTIWLHLIAYVSISTENRQKLEEQARKLVFVSYKKHIRLQVAG